MAKAKKPTKYIVTDGELTLTLEVAAEGGYVVTSPFDPDVLTQADTVEEAFEMARDVISLFEADRATNQEAKGVVGKRRQKLKGAG